MKELHRAFAGKTVLVTGHTGFKGSWLSLWLRELGAKVVGYALAPDADPSLFGRLGLSRLVDSRLGDVRDAALLEKTVRETRPEVVFHLAAQPLVRRSYEIPAETFAVNVSGVANLLDAARRTDSIRACVVVTTDKCYENREEDLPFREADRLGGRDPYSASKACAELVVSSYRDSFFGRGANRHPAAVASARAGNVIGGGDWAVDRILPDCVRALAAGRPIAVRNPRSVRPWQHVLEPAAGYLTLAAKLLESPEGYAEAWNFGPSEADARTVGEIADLAVKSWGSGSWKSEAPADAPHEARFLRLDSAKARARLGWRPVYDAPQAVAKTVAWHRAATAPDFDALAFTRAQIADYAAAMKLPAEVRR